MEPARCDTRPFGQAKDVLPRESATGYCDVQLPLDRCPTPGRLYLPRWNEALAERPAPGVVLCHGNDSRGQEHPLIVQLAEALATAGCYVLTFDNIGYGRGWRPPSGMLIHPEDADLRWAAFAGVTLLSSLPEVDAARLYTMGHSMGGAVALAAGAVDSRVVGAVGISPSQVTRVISKASDREKYRMSSLIERTMHLYVSANVVVALRHLTDPLLYVDQLRDKRVLITYVEDENMDSNYREWIESLALTLGQPNCSIVRYPGSDHHYGAAAGGPSSQLTEKLLRPVVAWLTADA
ncbi:MAG: alpha/beta fold hydrolase [Chloroflexi bacterium]|nr:alpha/beta fold hydrolase [Chloroflexota bacterium]